MTLFIKSTDIISVPELTAEDAQSIYSSFESGKSHTDLFKEWTPFEHSNSVSNEIKRLEQEVNLIMSGRKVKTPAVYGEEDENGERELISDVVYENAESQEDVVVLISSELLDETVLVNDCRRYADWDPDNDPDFTTRKESFSLDLI